MNLEDLEPLDSLGAEPGGQYSLGQMSMFIAYSQAVSLKRIADAMEFHAIEEAAKPGRVPSEDGEVVLFSFAPRPSGDTEEKPTKPRTRVKAGAALLTALPAEAINEGFIPYVDKAQAPVDRVNEVMVFHANGKKRLQAAGQVVWMSNEADPWRVLGYRLAGDGSRNTAE